MPSFVQDSDPCESSKTTLCTLYLDLVDFHWGESKIFIEVDREDWNATKEKRRRENMDDEGRKTKGETKGVTKGISMSVNVFSIKANPAGFSEGLLPAHLFPLLFSSLSLSSLPSVFYNVSRSPHLITLLAFSRMKELQRPLALRHA